MKNEFIYSPNSRLTKFRHACNLNTEFYAKKPLYSNCCLFIKTSDDISTTADVGYIYYDTDSNTSAGFIFVTQHDFSSRVQNFKQVCFSSYTRLFRIRTHHEWTYYRVDATKILHGEE